MTETEGWDRYREANRLSWDERVPIHVGSDFYGLEAFLRGQSKLRFFEHEELPPLQGKRLLHLQCHFGLDTLSLARRGAQVTGLDFSQPALEAAAALARRAGIDGARWVHSDLYDAPAALGGERFDVVYTGGGAINWLPDLRRWADVLAACTAPGGTLYIWEFHPFADTLDDERADGLLVVERPYFQGSQPQRWDDPGTYADFDAPTQHNETFEWTHPIGEVVSAIIAAGFRLEFLHEYAENAFRRLPQMVLDERRAEPGRPYYLLPDRPERMPMMYSLRAIRDADERAQEG